MPKIQFAIFIVAKLVAKFDRSTKKLSGVALISSRADLISSCGILSVSDSKLEEI